MSKLSAMKAWRWTSLLLALWLPMSIQAATFTVDSSLDVTDINPGDGACDDGSGNCTLRAAIQESNALPGPDAINIPLGTYTLSIAGTHEDAAATGDLDITDDLTITGASQETAIIDGSGIDRVVHVLWENTVEVAGVTIRNGQGGNDRGGGIFNNGTMTLTNSTVCDNAVNIADGGGISNYGTLTLTNSTVSGNAADEEGVDGGGGGISNSDTLTLINSTISDNIGGDEGGGLHQGSGGTLTLTNSTVSGNTAVNSHGGGIANFSGTIIITNSTISGNMTGFNGGGVWIGGGTLTVTNSTFSSNGAAANGGGIWNDDTANVTNSIFGNSPSGGNCGGVGVVTDGGGNLADDPTCGTIPNTLTGLDATLADNGGPTMTHSLLAGSTAIDAAGACGLSTDQRGFIRVDGLCDAGSFELGAIDFSWTPMTPDIGEGILFTIEGLAEDVVQATWDFGGIGCDGEPATQVCVSSLWDDCKGYSFAYASGGDKIVGLSIETASGTITAGPHTVSVASTGSCGGECTYSLSPTSRTIEASGGDGSFAINTTSGCWWTAGSHRSWITILSSSSGIGSGTVTYRVTANAGAARTGTISAGTRLFIVNQSSGSVPVNFTMSNPTPMIGEVVTFTVDPALDVASWNFGEADCRGNSPEVSCAFLPEGVCNNMQWTYPTAGPKSVTMRLTDGRSQTKTPTVRDVGACCPADGPPDASFIMGGSQAHVGEPVLFTDTSTGVGADAEPVGWNWTIYLDSVALVTSIDQQFSHTFGVPGVYMVELIVSNCLGSDTITKTLEIIDAQIEDSVFPAAVSLEGAFGTQWESDFRFFNPCDDLMSVRIEFLPEGTNNSGADLAFQGFTLDSGETRVFSSIFEAIPILEGDEVTGSVRVESSSAAGCKVVAASRTFNDTPFGTLGQFVPALSEMITDSQVLNFTGLIQNDGYRTNLRLVNFGDEDEWVGISPIDENGDPLTTVRYVLVHGHSTRQINNIASWLGVTGDLSLFSLKVDRGAAGVDAITTVMDNISGDPVLYVSSAMADEQVFLAGVAHVFGVNESQWRTDVSLANSTSEPLGGEMTFVPGDDPDVQYGFNWPPLSPGAATSYLDIVGLMLGGAETQGYLVVTGENGVPAPMVVARTYNLDPSGGTYGLNLRPYGSGDLLRSGQTGYVAGVSNSEDKDVGFRTNFGLLNTDNESWSQVRITLYNLDGTEAAPPFEFWIAPGVLQQFDVFRKLGLSDVTMTGSFKVEVLAGGAVAAFFSEIDNQTQDPIFIPVQRVFGGAGK